MEIANALWITLIGMSLVFVAILLLWGLMALLVQVTNKKNAPPEEEQAAAPEQVSDAVPDGTLLLDRKRRAAAAAAAVAEALNAAGVQKSLIPPASERAAGEISSWQAVNRANQISQRINASRKKVSR